MGFLVEKMDGANRSKIKWRGSLQLKLKTLSKKWDKKHKVLVLLVGIGSIIIFQIVYMELRTPPAFKKASEGKRLMEESFKKSGLVDYGNGTWGPPITERNATNFGNTNMVNKSTNQ